MEYATDERKEQTAIANTAIRALCCSRVFFLDGTVLKTELDLKTEKQEQGGSLEKQSRY